MWEDSKHNKLFLDQHPPTGAFACGFEVVKSLKKKLLEGLGRSLVIFETRKNTPNKRTKLVQSKALVSLGSGYSPRSSAVAIENEKRWLHEGTVKDELRNSLLRSL